MHIVQITPGAGSMYCGNCFRDNALVAALRRQGHDATMLPMYLPLTLDEADQSSGRPIFFGGISVYLEQKSALFQRLPNWLHRCLASPRLLWWASGRAAKTRPADVADITLSMLRGETGRQGRELDELIAWLKQQPHPEVINLSNALLVGMVRRLKQELRTTVVCTLQGEDYFLDGLPEPYRAQCWETLTERAAEVDLFIAPSRYFADLMTRRLGLRPDRVRVVYNGIELDGYPEAPLAATGKQSAPVLGFFARMCPEKGLDVLVEAFIRLKQRGKVPRLKLHVGGSCGPGDEPFVKGLRKRLAEAGYIGEVSFMPNLTREEKIHFLRGLTVFSVPARYSEAFGLYTIEALAAGVPLVQPRTSAFPEIIDATGGGVLCEPGDPAALAGAIEELLLNPEKARALGETGRQVVFERFNSDQMAAETIRTLEAVKQN